MGSSDTAAAQLSNLATQAAARSRRPALRFRGTTALLQPLIETVILLAAAHAASWLYFLLLAPPGFTPTFMNPFEAWSAVAAVFAPLVLERRIAARRPVHPARALLPAYALFAGMVTAAALAGGGIAGTAPVWLVLWLLLGYGGIAALRTFVPQQVAQSVAVVGFGPATDRLVRQLLAQGPVAVEFLGVFDDRATRMPAGVVPRAGTIAELIELGRRRPVDWVLVALPHHAELRIDEVLRALKSLSVSVALCPCGIELDQPQSRVDYVAGRLPVRLLADRPIRRWGAVAKGLEDYLLGVLLIAALSPLLLLIALAIRLEGPGPILFRQRRHAWNNGEFEVFKFRTMRWNPQAVEQPLVQTARDDPRITRVGRFLRRSSLDELPQLINVLRGEMSLVGPRPHAVDMRTEQRLGEEIIATYAHRHRVKPGITGWAQVNGLRGATHTVEQLRRRVQLDLEYVENWSIAFDLKVLFLTAWIVLRGTNAY